ncbi:hypothetical protein HanOQP8_Chr05g0171971 [Helianthus annuus]|nr:hypothetical protein HanHA89_Chr05g0174061 [Helianthus annuus]KAJ0745947.1 hypothetical protein HanOQP8_Chr05g0171971 [Helianthus annuus]
MFIKHGGVPIKRFQFRRNQNSECSKTNAISSSSCRYMCVLVFLVPMSQKPRRTLKDFGYNLDTLYDLANGVSYFFFLKGKLL